jgi:hypothetical protein
MRLSRVSTLPEALNAAGLIGETPTGLHAVT